MIQQLFDAIVLIVYVLLAIGLTVSLLKGRYDWLERIFLWIVICSIPFTIGNLAFGEWKYAAFNALTATVCFFGYYRIRAWYRVGE